MGAVKDAVQIDKLTLILTLKMKLRNAKIYYHVMMLSEILPCSGNKLII